MKKYLSEFLKRGLMAMGGGPLILAAIYFIHWKINGTSELSSETAAREILTISLMAFIASGITMIYRIEELPLFYAALIHGGVLYLDYLIIYLFNGWLKSGAAPFLIFTLCFVLGYLLIWVIINAVTRAHAKHLNNTLESKGK